MKDGQSDQKTDHDCPSAKTVGEIPDQWSGSNRMSGRERMLTALEQGVKGGKWYSLMDKVYATRASGLLLKRCTQTTGVLG